MKKFVKLIAGAATFGILSGAVFQGTNYCIRLYSGAGQESAATGADTISDNRPLTKVSASTGNEIAGVSDVAEAVLPSIVAIDVKVISEQRDFFGRTFQSEGSGSGSGIIFKEDSENFYMVTNNHVVDSSVEVRITFQDGSTADAAVTGTDADSDLAVVKVPKSSLKEDTVSNIKVAELADSTKIKVGEQAIAVGNALGYGTSVTVGYVSAKDREIQTASQGDGGQRQNPAPSGEGAGTMRLIQTDAAINPGNSGGALVNAKGQVIGINSSKFASEEVEGMGFAIPISDAIPIMEKLITGGSSGASGDGNNNDTADPSNGLM